MSSVKVAVRCRPFSQREIELNSKSIIEQDGHTTTIINTKIRPNSIEGTLGRERYKTFTYDYSYNSFDKQNRNFASQEKIFNDLGEELVESACQGYNGCIFSYGQTGSGKTFTMTGSLDNAGLTPRMCQKLFSLLSDDQSSYRIEISYCEIYNEKVRDLLRDFDSEAKPLKVREHPKDGPYVQGLSKHSVFTYEAVEQFIQKGNDLRATASTVLNDVSSRSHAIFTIAFTQAKMEDDIPSEIHSKLHLVDLAGSERADVSGTSGLRLKEGGSINKSLVTLGNVISTLADLSDKFASVRKNVFVPYRDSVLTWLLKDSLGGNSNTVMIATISPADCCYAESLSTLRYAHRAKKILNQPIINEDPNVRLIRELKEENNRLRALLVQTGSPVDVLENQERLNRNEARVKVLTERWEGRWKEETFRILDETALDLKRSKCGGIRVESEQPHFIGLDDCEGTVLIFHLSKKVTTVGRDEGQHNVDIALNGSDIEQFHCDIEIQEDGRVTLSPRNGAKVYINNRRAVSCVAVCHGSIIQFGQHMFRFNNPAEAQKENSNNSNVLISRNFSWTSTIPDSDFESQSESKRPISVSNVGVDIQDLGDNDEHHIRSEADRLSKILEQEALKAEIEEEKKELVNLRESAKKAREEVKRLSANVEEEARKALEHSENVMLKQEQTWKRLSEEKKKHVLDFKKEQTRLEKERQIEHEIFSQEMKDIRTMVDQEITDMRNLMDLASITESESSMLSEEDIKTIMLPLQVSNRPRNLNINSLKKQEKDEKKEELSPDSLNGLDLSTTNDNDIATPSSLGSLNEYKLNLGSSFDVTPEAGEEFSTKRKLFSDSLEGKDVTVEVIDGYDWSLPDEYLKKTASICLSDSESECYFSTKEYLSEEEDLEDDMTTCLTESVVSGKAFHLAEKVRELHNAICSAIQRKYGSVLSDDGIELFQNVIPNLFSIVRPLFEELERQCEREPDSCLESQLSTHDQTLSTLDSILQTHESVCQLDTAISNNNWSFAHDKLNESKKYLGEIEVNSEVEIASKKLLQTEVCVLREKLFYNLSEKWDEFFRFKIPLNPKLFRRQTRNTSLHIKKTTPDNIVHCVETMHKCNLLKKRLKTFSDKLHNYFIKPIVSDSTMKVLVEDEPSAMVLRLSSSGHRSSTPNAWSVLESLQTVFFFLHRPFRGCSVGQEPLTQAFGDNICPLMFEELFNNCLRHLMPEKTCDWGTFDQIVAEAEKFQNTLNVLGFLKTNEEKGKKNLLDYFNNVSSLFVQARSQEVLRKVHQLLAQDMKKTVQVTADQPLGKDFSSFDDLSLVENTVKPKNQSKRPHSFIEGWKGSEETWKLNKPTKDLEVFVSESKRRVANALKLPKCHVSIAIRHIVILSYSILKQVEENSRDGATNLAATIRHLAESVCDFLPKNFVVSDSYLAALHNNNCMYFAHHLLIMDAVLLKRMKQYNGMADVISRIRKLGNQFFADYIEYEKGILTTCLMEAKGFVCAADDEECISRVFSSIHQRLHTVSTLWRDNLPVNTFFRGLGSLVQFVVLHISSCLLTITEYSLQDCSTLTIKLSSFLQICPQLFFIEEASNAVEVVCHDHVASWLRLNEIVRLLDAKLSDIEDRWASGKGPLALHLNANEVRQLVVAMFEESPRRRTLLSSLT